MSENEERPGQTGRGRRQSGGQPGRDPRGGSRDGRRSFPSRGGSGQSRADSGRSGAGRGSERSGSERRDDSAAGRRDAGDGRPRRDERPRRGGDYRREDEAGRRDAPGREGADRRDARTSRDDRPRRGSRDGGQPSWDERRRGRPGADRGRRSGPERQGSRERGPEGRERREHVAEHSPGDLRSANRPDRAKSPEIDADVTGKELDRATQRELDSLDERNRPWVAKHLVMAGQLLDIDPQLSFEHALAASRRGGRLGCVREAVALTAYAAGHYADALREFRTYRRITGDNTHLPEMVDSERALGRHAKALELAGEVDPRTLDRAIRVELVMVLSGIHRDVGDADSALKVLQVPELDRNRGFSFSPRLFRAYADALEGAGRGAEARDWRHQARVAERALGIGEFADPEIVDFGVEEEPRPERRPRARDLVPPGTAAEESAEGPDESALASRPEDVGPGQDVQGEPSGADERTGRDLQDD